MSDNKTLKKGHLLKQTDECYGVNPIKDATLMVVLDQERSDEVAVAYLTRQKGTSFGKITVASGDRFWVNPECCIRL